MRGPGQLPEYSDEKALPYQDKYPGGEKEGWVARDSEKEKNDWVGASESEKEFGGMRGTNGA